MKTTTIATAKIKSDRFELIKNGIKHYEVQDESFHGATAIRYVDSETGKVLGVYWLGPEDVFDRTHDQLLQTMTVLNSTIFYKLFPKDEGRFGISTVDHLYVAPILCHTDLDSVLKKDLEDES